LKNGISRYVLERSAGTADSMRVLSVKRCYGTMITAFFRLRKGEKRLFLWFCPQVRF